MALKAGEPVDAEAGGLAADSLAPRRVGKLVFPIAQSHVDRVVLVPDDAISRAQQALWETLRIVAEPGGAAGFAALLSGRYHPRPGEHIGVLLERGEFRHTINSGAERWTAEWFDLVQFEILRCALLRLQRDIVIHSDWQHVEFDDRSEQRWRGRMM